MSKKKKPSKVKSFFSDFKAFITKGSIFDLAVAVVIGAAFGKIVTSLVNDIIMPVVTKLIGGNSVADWKIVLVEEVLNADGAVATAECAIYYGNFIQAIIDFLIVAFFIFLALRIIIGIKNTLAKQNAGEIVFDKAERKAIAKQLKSEGKNKAEIGKIIAAKEADIIAAKKAEEDKKAKEETAKHQTTEQLLTQIRDLLAKQK